MVSLGIGQYLMLDWLGGEGTMPGINSFWVLRRCTVTAIVGGLVGLLVITMLAAAWANPPLRTDLMRMPVTISQATVLTRAEQALLEAGVTLTPPSYSANRIGFDENFTANSFSVGRGWSSGFNGRGGCSHCFRRGNLPSTCVLEPVSNGAGFLP